MQKRLDKAREQKRQACQNSLLHGNENEKAFAERKCGPPKRIAQSQ
jgi:hypothetical protein